VCGFEWETGLLAGAGTAFEARDGEMESRSFAMNFFNMTGSKRVSVAETPGFATLEAGSRVDP
jgi:hypothetical protein